MGLTVEPVNRPHSKESPIGPLAHQSLITKAIEENSVTSISAPRQNGKTWAAIAGATWTGGRTLFISNGYAAAKIAHRMAEDMDWPAFKVTKSRRTNGELFIERENDSVIHFMPYSKSGARGLIADTLIFDDADCVDADMLEAHYPAIFASRRPRIVALSIAPDQGLAKHVCDLADKELRWMGLDEATANPALGHLIRPESLENAKRMLPPDVYRRECLGLGEGEYELLKRQSISSVIGAQLAGQTFEACQ